MAKKLKHDQEEDRRSGDARRMSVRRVPERMTNLEFIVSQMEGPLGLKSEFIIQAIQHFAAEVCINAEDADAKFKNETRSDAWEATARTVRRDFAKRYGAYELKVLPE